MRRVSDDTMPMVYVVMPVGSDPAYPARRAAIDRAVVSVGMIPFHPMDRRPHSVEFDAAEIRFEVQRAVVVVADLSLERPSCYYEIGVAQGTGVPTILVAERGTPIHQTAGRADVAFYDTFDELVALVAARLDAHRPAPVA
jgi:hypothetical protein